MPQIPKFFADITAKLIKKAAVVSTHYYTADFKKIVMQGDDLVGRSCEAGAQIEPRVGDTAFRHYNPSHFDKERGICEMLLYLHDKGPGSKWAQAIKTGDDVYFMGPANKIRLDKAKNKVVLLGDETAIGTFLFMQNARGTGQQFAGAVETEKHLLQLPDTVGLTLPAVLRTDNKDSALLKWLENNFEQHRTAQYYLLGNEADNDLLRSFLKGHAISNSQITTRPYWKEGKKGL